MKFRSRVFALLLLSVILLGTGASSGNTQVSGNAGAVRPLAVDAGGDTCATATTIPSVPFNDTGDTTGATDNIRLTGCVGLSLEGPDLVYAFTVFAGNNLTFTLTPSALDPDYDPAIYIRTACAQGAGSCVARQDVGGSGQAETITVSSLAPGTYYFFIDSIYPADDVAGMGRYSLSVTGTFGVPNNTSFYTLTPCRILDTRLDPGPLGGPALAAGSTRVFPIWNQCSVPPTAKSVSVNITVTQPTSPGHLILFPGGTPPTVSAINFRAGQTRANNAIVPLSGTGTISVADGQGSGTTHFILDVNGYFQ
jgi:hypothetical protein